MKTRSYQLMVNSSGHLVQENSFDHLMEEKIARMNKCLNRLGQSLDAGITSKEHTGLCSEADLFASNATPQAINQWYAVMSCFDQEESQEMRMKSRE